jgi:hypothetical protein
MNPAKGENTVINQARPDRDVFLLLDSCTFHRHDRTEPAFLILLQPIRIPWLVGQVEPHPNADDDGGRGLAQEQPSPPGDAPNAIEPE